MFSSTCYLYVSEIIIKLIESICIIQIIPPAPASPSPPPSPTPGPPHPVPLPFHEIAAQYDALPHVCFFNLTLINGVTLVLTCHFRLVLHLHLLLLHPPYLNLFLGLNNLLLHMLLFLLCSQ